MSADLAPPKRRSLLPDLKRIDASLIPTVAARHVRYLDDRIEYIDELTAYLNQSETIDGRKNFYIQKVISALTLPDGYLDEYARWYLQEYINIRSQVELLCDQTYEAALGSNAVLAEFWREFSHLNEVDNFHGMFLTSGRWNVNFMMPVLRSLLDRGLAEIGERLEPAELQELIVHLVTPRFAPARDWNNSTIVRAATILSGLLAPFDRRFLFLADPAYSERCAGFSSIEEFASSIIQRSDGWVDLLDQGVFPPFAWSELQAPRSPRTGGSAQESVKYKGALDAARNAPAFALLTLFKSLELDYHLYNYKGRFGLVSKPLYMLTEMRLSPAAASAFSRAIYLDAFLEAGRIVDVELGR